QPAAAQATASDCLPVPGRPELRGHRWNHFRQRSGRAARWRRRDQELASPPGRIRTMAGAAMNKSKAQEPGTEESAVLAALGQKLAAQAHEQALVDVAYRIVDSPLGSLLLASTQNGLARVAFESEDHDR